MKNLYEQGSANFPRLKTDTFFADYANEYHYTNFLDHTFRYVEDFQLLRPDLWKRFVQQFREHPDTDYGWRGEYWGKMMRGACFVYTYTQNADLYNTLADTVRDMMTTMEENGRISSYPEDIQFDGWDMWCRKYVLLGMQYFLEICTDEALRRAVIDSMCRQMGHITAHLGEGRMPVPKASNFWRGLNSSSILEPVVRLYSLTGEQKYLDFAKHIVDCGGTDVANIFEYALQDNFMPYQYPVTKAYEMTSCFEGLLEYYRITGEENYKTAVINFANRILETDFTVIGSCGCTHELFDHSTVRQANTNNGEIMQETCVTVTLMKFFYQVHLLTGDPKFADAFEISLYNAYLGAVNTEKVIEPLIRRDHPDWIAEPLPFDSYSPLTAGTRGNGIGGLKIMSDMHYYGCCACIGSAGIGLVPKMQLLTAKDGFALNLFIAGSVQTETPAGQKAVFTLTTDYPKSGHVSVQLTLEHPEAFTLRVRNPQWSRTTAVTVNGESIEAAPGYITLSRTWQNGDTVELSLDLHVEAIRPISYGQQLIMTTRIHAIDYMIPTFDREDPIAHRHIALRRGPLMLAQENRLGYSVDDPIEVAVNADGIVDAALPETDSAPYPHLLEMRIPLTDGTYQTVTDYASAGKLWTEESKMAVWMLTK
ncbi:MAG: glycoside hydrolase family 127 protein [Clostridia bacterium]|nr:glycoside hydrolase family 127 protein [Clostridia bacterium]